MVVLNFFPTLQKAIHKDGFNNEIDISLFDDTGNLVSSVYIKNHDGISEITVYYNDKIYVYNPTTMTIRESMV